VFGSRPQRFVVSAGVSCPRTAFGLIVSAAGTERRLEKCPAGDAVCVCCFIGAMQPNVAHVVGREHNGCADRRRAAEV
jgi:hypothetical protein